MKKYILLLYLLTTPIFAKQYEHPQNLYNKALEAYEKQDLGTAMFYAKGAMKLSPGSKNTRILFFKLRQELGLPTIFSEDQFSQQLSTFLFQSFPPHVDAFFAGVLFILGAGLLSLIILNQISISKYIPTTILALSFLMMLQSTIQYQFFKVDERVILTSTALYEEASLDGTVLQNLKAGTELTVIDQSEEFLLIKLLNSSEGWISKDAAPPLLTPISK
ncbi:MAG: SH3 domain-containing protein [Brevinema sp.]